MYPSNTTSITDLIRITTVLVSRFLLDLQSANRKAVDSSYNSEVGMGTSTNSQTSTLVFEKVVRPLGSSISYGARDDQEIDDRLESGFDDFWDVVETEEVASKGGRECSDVRV